MHYLQEKEQKKPQNNITKFIKHSINSLYTPFRVCLLTLMVPMLGKENIVCICMGLTQL